MRSIIIHSAAKRRRRSNVKTKMTKAERNWVLYDVGNSEFVLLVSTIMPIYFNYLAGNAGLSSVDYLAYWGYATSAATIIVALLGPVFGTLADTKGLKKPIFTVTMLIGGIGCLALGFARQWMVFLIIYIIAKTGFSGSLIFYDSMLGDVTTEDRMDNVSSQGYAWGYIGSCVPFVVCLGIVLGAGKIGISMELAMMISFAIVAVWWIGATIPLLKIYKQKHYVERKPRAIRNSQQIAGLHVVAAEPAAGTEPALDVGHIEVIPQFADDVFVKMQGHDAVLGIKDAARWPSPADRNPPCRSVPALRLPSACYGSC